jgi:hypothetical protein
MCLVYSEHKQLDYDVRDREANWCSLENVVCVVTVMRI